MITFLGNLLLKFLYSIRFAESCDGIHLVHSEAMPISKCKYKFELLFNDKITALILDLVLILYINLNSYFMIYTFILNFVELGVQ